MCKEPTPEAPCCSQHHKTTGSHSSLNTPHSNPTERVFSIGDHMLRHPDSIIEQQIPYRLSQSGAHNEPHEYNFFVVSMLRFKLSD